MIVGRHVSETEVLDKKRPKEAGELVRFRLSAARASATVSLVLLLALSSCTSQYGLSVPGQDRIIIKNLSIEYYNIAEAYMDVKKYAQAADYYRLAMRDKTLYVQSYYKLGRAYALSQDWDNALAVYTDLLTRDKDNIDLQQSVVYIVAMRGDIDDALQQYRELLQQYPNNQTLRENYVSLLVETGRGEVAEQELSVLKEKFPDSTVISSLTEKIAELVDNMDRSAEDEDDDETAEESDA